MQELLWPEQHHTMLFPKHLASHASQRMTFHSVVPKTVKLKAKVINSPPPDDGSSCLLDQQHLPVNPVFAVDAVASCAMLHNICLRNGETLELEEDALRSDGQPEPYLYSSSLNRCTA